MSNGSEHTPERCVHAVDGPDWAGLRELPTPKPDYEALIEEVRALFDEGWCVCRSSHLPGDLLDAVEALLAENEKHSADLHEWETVGAPAWVAAKDAQLAEAWAERDALQARLDAMTVETRRTRVPATQPGPVICPTCGKRTYPFLHSCPYKGMPHHWWVDGPTPIHPASEEPSDV